MVFLSPVCEPEVGKQRLGAAACLEQTQRGRRKKFTGRDSPGCPVVKTLCVQSRGRRFDPWSGNRDPTSYVVWPKKTKFMEHLENMHVFHL